MVKPTEQQTEKLSSLFDNLDKPDEAVDTEIKKKKLDLAHLLGSLDLKNREYYNNLSDDEKKLYSPYVLMRYMSSSTSNHDISLIITNEIVNKNFGDLYKHPELIHLLFTIIGGGSKLFHKWLPPAKRKKSETKLDTLLYKIYPSANSLELEMLKKMATKEEIIQLCKDYAYSDDEIDSVLKEIK